MAAANIGAQPKVVVDSFRFPYFVDNGTVANPGTNTETVKQGSNAIYSVRRLQPYRGGHYVPRADLYDMQSYDPTLSAYTANPAGTINYAPNPYGFSEQTSPPQPPVNASSSPPVTANAAAVTQATLASPNPIPQGSITTTQTLVGTYAVTNPAGAPPYLPTQITAPIYHSLKSAGAPADNWDYFPFFDRDFQSVAELTLVPAVPPGLFTKMFVERQDPHPYNTTSALKYDLPPPSWPSMSAPSPQTTPNTLYTVPYTKPPFGGNQPVGSNPNPTNLPPGQNVLQPPSSNVYAVNGANTTKSTLDTSPGALTPSTNNAGVRLTNDPITFPYLAEGFHYTNGALFASHSTASPPSIPPTGAAQGVTVPAVRNPASGIGWYKFLEFFEVPSPVMGHIGPAVLGKNLDWQRQDLKPGMLNLNLIVDEEVFFGLVDDWRLSTFAAFYAPPDRTNPMFTPTTPNNDGSVHHHRPAVRRPGEPVSGRDQSLDQQRPVSGDRKHQLRRARRAGLCHLHLPQRAAVHVHAGLGHRHGRQPRREPERPRLQLRQFDLHEGVVRRLPQAPRRRIGRGLLAGRLLRPHLGRRDRLRQQHDGPPAIPAQQAVPLGLAGDEPVPEL